MNASSITADTPSKGSTSKNSGRGINLFKSRKINNSYSVSDLTDKESKNINASSLRSPSVISSSNKDNSDHWHSRSVTKSAQVNVTSQHISSGLNSNSISASAGHPSKKPPTSNLSHSSTLQAKSQSNFVQESDNKASHLPLNELEKNFANSNLQVDTESHKSDLDTSAVVHSRKNRLGSGKESIRQSVIKSITSTIMPYSKEKSPGAEEDASNSKFDVLIRTTCLLALLLSFVG